MKLLRLATLSYWAAPCLAAACMSQRMEAALEEVFGNDRNTTILHVQHFKPGDYMLSTTPSDNTTKPTIPLAEHGTTVVKLFIRTTGEAPAEPDRSAGTDVGYEFWFPDPDAWSGRILNMLEGGWLGNPRIMDPASSAKPMFTTSGYAEWASKSGFVVAQTDGGHSTAMYPKPGYNGALDTSYLITKDGEYNVEGWKNMAWQATHLMAEKSKQIAAAFYREEHSSAYLLGCSTSGRQAYQMAQQFPHDYNGILAMAPSYTGTRYYPSIGHPTIVMNNDKVEPFTATQLEIVSQKALAHGDTAITGQHDGYVTDWLSNEYDPTTDASILRVEDGGNCTDAWAISMAQAHALNKIWYGPTRDGTYPSPSVDNGRGLVGERTIRTGARSEVSGSERSCNPATSQAFSGRPHTLTRRSVTSRTSTGQTLGRPSRTKSTISAWSTERPLMTPSST